MAATRVCVLLVVFCTCVREMLAIKGLYCRDPDTGKLYGVNSTWASATFCGNYTCKLRRANSTETQYAPSRKVFNITHVDFLDGDEKLKVMKAEDAIHERLNRTVTVEENMKPEMQSILQKENVINEITSNVLEKSAREIFQNNNAENTDDRYLTENEIKALTDLFHSVKKSDLEAIVEIYSLAQDIYKEMDKTTSATLGQEVSTVRDGTELLKENSVQTRTSNRISYWYEPLQINNNNKITNDLQHQGSDIIATARPVPVQVVSYFGGPLNRNDFKKIPYYYPMSNFQRLSSYVHNKPSNLRSYEANTKPLCETPTTNMNVAPVTREPSSKHLTKEFISLPSWIFMNRPVVDIQRRPTLLPFPYSMQYNFSYPSTYYNTNTWSNFAYYNKKNYPEYLSAYIQMPKNSGYVYPEVTKTPTNADLNPINVEKESYLLDTLLASVDKRADFANDDAKKTHSWITEPLPANVIEEVRAKVADKIKIKAFPLRKKVKLEKVAKVFKVDDVFSRNKRDVNEEDTENYEVYIEKVMCESDTRPGYFRIGNNSQPYPACCPQRIDNR